MSIKNYEGQAEDQVVKAGLVALGNVLFTWSNVERPKRLGCVGFCVLDDISELCRSPSCPTVIDLIQAYGLVLFGGCIPYFSVRRKQFWNSLSMSPIFFGTCSKLFWDSPGS